MVVLTSFRRYPTLQAGSIARGSSVEVHEPCKKSPIDRIPTELSRGARVLLPAVASAAPFAYGQ